MNCLTCATPKSKQTCPIANNSYYFIFIQLLKIKKNLVINLSPNMSKNGKIQSLKTRTEE